MDVTVVNVALPSIQSDFHTNLSTLQWVTDGYTLMVASLLLLSGHSMIELAVNESFNWA